MLGKLNALTPAAEVEVPGTCISWKKYGQATEYGIDKTADAYLVRLTDKPWLKVLLADLLWEKNTVILLKKYDE